MRRITSRQNPLVTRFRDLARGPGTDGQILLDGEHLLQEALAAGIPIDTVAMSERAGRTADDLVSRLERAGAEVFDVSTQVLAAVSPVRQPSGIVAIARVAAATPDDVLKRTPALVLVLAGIQDAGNVGAIIRAAEACGATGAIATEGTADPFGWKALRGAMGSTFRLPVAVRQPLRDTLDRLDGLGIPLLATVPRGGIALPDCDLSGAAAIVLGAEGAGVPDAVSARAQLRVTIPMQPPVESLNVAITAALILYEAFRQRRSP